MTDQQDLARPWWLLPLGQLHPMWWTAIGAAFIATDYAMGPSTQFPVLYVIPVTLAAWYSGRAAALALATIVPLVHLLFQLWFWKLPDVATLIATTTFRAAVIIIMALWFARLSEHERALHRYLKRLEGLLPICAFCKSIRNKAGDWEPLETYISSRSEAEFSHGFCPSCGKTHYPHFQADDASLKVS